jgi:type III pantothenate kinase
MFVATDKQLERRFREHAAAEPAGTQKRIVFGCRATTLAPMLLAADVGNTNVTLGLFDGKELKHRFRFGSLRDRTEDECGALLHQMLSMRSIKPADISAAILASVVPPITEVMCHAIRKNLAHDPLVVGGPGVKTGISVLYDNPRDVGADRIVNAVAAYDRYHSGVIVVDFGTATTLDCVSPKAEYLGGVIVPGVEVSLAALLGRAAKLGPVELTAPPHVVGRNTPHAIQSGIVFGYAGLVDGLVKRITQELPFECAVLATGGLARLIVPEAQSVNVIDENLTLTGLRLLYEKNRQVTPQSGGD